VIAVWVATAPRGGSFVVGWYKDATVFRHWQKPPTGARRQHNGDEFGYYVASDASEATLLRPDERTFAIPRGKNGMGQSNVWYADSTDAPSFRSEVLNYLETRLLSQRSLGPNTGIARQSDPLLRQKIERAAIQMTAGYYRGLGYKVESFEKDNLGWDLNAEHPSGRFSLKLEMKGLSGSELTIELTPNEYAQMKNNRVSYRVCVVTKALDAPILTIFEYSQDSQRWEDQRKHALQIEEVIAARCLAR
jgi:hypothetical protein